MDTRRILTSIARRWWVVVLCLGIGLGAGFAATQLITPEYTATTRLFVSTTGGTSSTESYQGDQFSQQRTASYAHLLNSEQVSQRVIDELGLAMSADELAGHVTAAIVPRTVLLDVSVTNSNPGRAADIANTLADQFIAFTGPLETPAGQSEPRSRVTIVSKAEAPTSPSYPELTTNLLYGAIAGLAVGLLIAVLTAMLSRRIRNTDELTRITGSSSFGPVDLTPRDSQERAQQLSEWNGPDAEGFRRLRAQVEAHDPAPQVILVSSVTSGDTGAGVAADLAVAFAEAGRRTALVSSSAEFGSLAETFGLDKASKGLAEWFRGTSINDVVHTTSNPSLYLVPPGKTGDLEPKLSSPEMSRLLDELRKSFERVVLVTAGVNESSGASVLSAISDVDLLIVDRPTASRRDVHKAMGELRAVRAHLMGAVLVSASG